MLTAAILALVVSSFVEYDIEPTGGELSGISRVPRTDRYWAVSDKGVTAYEFAIRPTETGLVFRTLRTVSLKGRHDCEGCAFDPLTKLLFVSDEYDNTVRAFDLATGDEKARVAIPKNYAKCRQNYSIEGVSISPDGLELWISNEEPTKEDKDFVRITKFTRASAAEVWKVASEIRYRPDPVVGAKFLGRYALSGVADLVALGAGRLLVLERECSVKDGGLFPTCRARLYRPTASGQKELVWEANTGLANYEGICLGPSDAKGHPTLYLVSDAGSGADDRFAILTLK